MNFVQKKRELINEFNQLEAKQNEIIGKLKMMEEIEQKEGRKDIEVKPETLEVKPTAEKVA